MATGRYLRFVVITCTLGWLTLATLPSPWWRVIPMLFFCLPTFLPNPMRDKFTPTLRDKVLGWVFGLLLIAGLILGGSALDRAFGKEAMESVVTSWQFALGGWSLSMLLIGFAMKKAKANGTWLK